MNYVDYEALDALSRSILACLDINEVINQNGASNGTYSISYRSTTIGTIEMGEETVSVSLFTYDAMVSNSLKDEYFLQALLCKISEFTESNQKNFFILDGAEELLNEQRPFEMWEWYGYLLTIEGNQLLFELPTGE